MPFLKVFSSQTLRLLGAVLVLSIAALPTLPSYLTHNWSWNHLPQVAVLGQMQAIQRSGLSLPGWQTQAHQAIEINQKKWSAQTLTALPANPASPAIYLLLRPQTWYRDQPGVEWMDIHGRQQWTEDDRQWLELKVSPIAPVKARFLRGWNEQQTYAVLQWYIWSTGGGSSPAQWFWADQAVQWRSALTGHRQRLPWVAACLLIPIQPLGDTAAARQQATSVGNAVQSALMNLLQSQTTP